MGCIRLKPNAEEEEERKKGKKNRKNRRQKKKGERQGETNESSLGREGDRENPLFRVTRKAYLAPLDHLPATILLESRELCSTDENATLKDFERRPLPPNQLLLDLLVIQKYLDKYILEEMTV